MQQDDATPAQATLHGQKFWFPLDCSANPSVNMCTVGIRLPAVAARPKGERSSNAHSHFLPEARAATTLATTAVCVEDRSPSGSKPVVVLLFCSEENDPFVLISVPPCCFMVVGCSTRDVVLEMMTRA